MQTPAHKRSNATMQLPARTQIHAGQVSADALMSMSSIELRQRHRSSALSTVTRPCPILNAREALRNAGVERSHHKRKWKSDSQAAFKIIQQRALPKSNAVRRFVLEMSQLNDIEMVHIPGWRNPADPIARQWQLSGNQLRVPLANARMALEGLARTPATPTPVAATVATRTSPATPARRP